MLWYIDPSSSVPIFEQLAACVRRAIAERTVSRGEKLPAARELAASLDVNVHTVLRAYQLLRDEGLVELRRGRGAVVLAAEPGHGQLAQLVDDLVRQGARLGLGRSELAAMVQGER